MPGIPNAAVAAAAAIKEDQVRRRCDMETILFSVKNTLLKAAMHLGGDGSSVEIRLRQNTNAEMTMLSCARSSVVVVKFFRTVR